MFDFLSEVSGTADEEQDIAEIKALSRVKVGKEVCHQRLIPYDARKISNDSRGNSTEAMNRPIKEKRES